MSDRCLLHPTKTAVGATTFRNADTGEDEEVPACLECFAMVGGILGEGEDAFVMGVISTGSPCRCGPGFCASEHGCGFYGYCNESQAEAAPDCAVCGIDRQSTAGCWSCGGNETEIRHSNTNKLLLRHELHGTDVFDLQDKRREQGEWLSYEDALNLLIAAKTVTEEEA